MEGNPVGDIHQFYNNRYLRKNDDTSPQVHSYSTSQTTEKRKRQKRKIKLLPVRSEKGSDGRYVRTDSEKLDEKVGNGKSGSTEGYLPAELSVQELLPGKQDGDKQLPQNGDVVIITAHDSSVLGEMKTDLAAQSNPYNGLNNKFASVLMCPACICMFYLFCYPALTYQKRSDKAYAEYDFKEAKRSGTAATVFYIGGVLFGLCFYAFCVLLAIYIARCFRD